MSRQYTYLVAIGVALALGISLSAGCLPQQQGAKPTVEAQAAGTETTASAGESVSIVSPLNGSTAYQNRPVTLVIDAVSTQGISRVELFFKDQLIGKAESPPPGVPHYRGSLIWTPGEAGSVTITVWAYTQQGKAIGPAPVLLNVAPDPDITILQAQPTSTLTPPCTSSAILDKTNTPDGLQVLPGATMTTIWQVKNNGNCRWDSYYKLVFVGGERMDGEEKIPVQGVVGEQGTAEFRVNLHAPQTPGIHEGRWRMEDPNGQKFGSEVYLRIDVIGPTATPTAISPTTTPTSPMIRFFTASPASISRGQYSTLSWDVGGAAQIYLYPGGENGVPSNGSRTVSPSDTTSYRLVAIYGGIRDEKQVTVTITDAGLPDLIVEDIGLSPNNRIRLRVRNAGQGAATQSFRIHVEKSGRSVWDYDVPGLSAGQSLSFEVEQEPVTGRETVRVVVDSLHAIQESQENNNEKSVELGANHQVTVNFTQVTVHNDGTPAGNGKIAFKFRVNGQEKRYPTTGYLSIGDGETLPLNEQITIRELPVEQSLDILAQGLLNTTESAEVSLGQVRAVYQYANANWQAGQHNELSNEGNGSFTVYYIVSVQ